jgi:hypothetical protein
MRVTILNYIAATDTLVVMCDGHLITHVRGSRPEQISVMLPEVEDDAPLCDRDVALALIYGESGGDEPAALVGMSCEYTDPRRTLRFTGHTGSLISYVYYGDEKHVAIDDLAMLHLKMGDDLTMDTEQLLLGLAYEVYILDGNTVSIIGCEVRPGDLERG